MVTQWSLSTIASQETSYNNFAVEPSTTNNMQHLFEVQTTTVTTPDVFNPYGWFTVYETESDCIEDAKRQIRYIMSSDQTRAQYLHPTAIRLIRNGVVIEHHCVTGN